jgi:hypothetical protein
MEIVKSQQDLVKLVKSIGDGESATLTLTDGNNNQHTIQGVYKESEAPCFFFLGPAGSLPENLDNSWRCFFISNDAEGKEVSFLTDVVKQNSSRIVEMVARQTVRFEDMRRFFRVTLRTPVAIHFTAPDQNSDDNDWHLAGETVDISQTGILVLLPEECRNAHGLDIELTLDQPPKTIFCTGHLVRTKRLKKERWLTTFHFDEISTADRDTLAKRCFVEQRRQLRDKGQTY